MGTDVEDFPQRSHIVTDGSVKGYRGAYAWKWTKRAQVLAEGSTVMGGISPWETAMRTELQSVVAAMQWVTEVYNKRPRPMVRVAVWNDNKRVITQITETQERQRMHYMHKEPNLMRRVDEILNETRQKIRWTFRWIKKEKTGKTTVLIPGISTTHAWVDLKATRVREAAHRRKYQHLGEVMLPGDMEIYVGNDRVSENGFKELKRHAQKKRIDEYTLTKFGKLETPWDAGIMKRVDWEAFEHAMKQQTVARRVTVSRMVFKWWHTGERQGWYDRKATPCHRCKHAIESSEHVLTCKAPESVASRKEAVKGIKEWFEETKTAPYIREKILYELLQDNEETVNPQMPRTQTQRTKEYIGAVQEQAKISWDQFKRGRISKKWRSAQEWYLRYRGAKKGDIDGKKWSRDLIVQLWGFSMAVWISRNAELHGATREEQLKNKRKELEETVQEYMHSITREFRENNAPLFDEFAWKKRTDDELERWIREMRPAPREDTESREAEGHHRDSDDRKQGGEPSAAGAVESRRR